MNLPADVARCPGVGDDVEGWREGCEDCRRRTTASGDRVWWMTPPQTVAFECEYRIGDGDE